MVIAEPQVAAERAERFALRWKERAEELNGEAGQVARDAARDVRALCDYVASVEPGRADAPTEGTREGVTLYDPEGEALPGDTVPHPPPTKTQGADRCRAVTHAAKRCRRPARDEALFCGIHAGRNELLNGAARP